MKINKEKLLEACVAVRPGLGKKDASEQTDRLFFSKRKIFTYNEKIFTVYPLNSDMECSVLAEEFYEFVGRIEEEELEISFDKEKGELLVEAGQSRSGMMVMEIDEIQKTIDMMDVPKADEWKLLPEGFAEALHLCSFAASKDTSLHRLNSLSIVKNQVVASDDLRISVYDLGEEMGEFLIPLAAVNELYKYRIREYHVGERWIYFRAGRVSLFATKTVTEKPLVVEHLFEFDGTEFFVPPSLLGAVETTSVFAEGNLSIDKAIEIEMKDGVIRCRGQNEVGWAEVEVDCDYDGEVSFVINPIFLSEVLGRVKEGGTIKCSDKLAMISFGPFRHLMSLRVR